MRKPGRPLKPTQQLKLTGRYQPSRHAGRAQPALKLPVPDPRNTEPSRIKAARKKVDGRAGRRFFDEVTAEWSGWTNPDLELLVRACQAIDRIEEARELIARDGLLVDGAKGGQCRNPAVLIESRTLTELRALLKQLDLEEER